MQTCRRGGGTGRVMARQAHELTFYEPEISNGGSCIFSGLVLDVLSTCSSSGLQSTLRGCIAVLEMPHPNQTTYPTPSPSCNENQVRYKRFCSLPMTSIGVRVGVEADGLLFTI